MKKPILLAALVLLTSSSVLAEGRNAKVLLCDFDAKFSPKTGAPLGKDLTSLAAETCKFDFWRVYDFSFNKREANRVEVRLADFSSSGARRSKREAGDRAWKGYRYVSIRFPDFKSASEFKAGLEGHDFSAISFRPNDYETRRVPYDAATDVVVIQKAGNPVIDAIKAAID